MTFWADNIRFIKEVQDSKYQKIEEAIAKVSLNEKLSLIELKLYKNWYLFFDSISYNSNFT